jgi:hypothetical protein
MMARDFKMVLLPCPYLGEVVELTDERQQHILSTHPDFLPEYFTQLAETVADPDEVRRDIRFPATRLFSRWSANVKGGKFTVVAVVSDPLPRERHWIVTAYLARKLTQGDTEWKRS